MSTSANAISSFRRPSLILGALLSIGLLACGKNTDDGETAAAEPVAEAVGSNSGSGAETTGFVPTPDSAGEPSSASDGDAVRVESHSQTGASAPSGETTITTRSTGGDVRVTIRNMTYYCKPAPVFSKSKEGDTLRLFINKPTGPVTRCVAAHDLTLVVAGADRDASIATVEVLATDGTLIASAAIVRTR